MKQNEKFIGKIDNLAEAILVLEMYDLVLTMKKKKQVHLKTTNGFEYI
jgi:hypothetical protein